MAGRPVGSVLGPAGGIAGEGAGGAASPLDPGGRRRIAAALGLSELSPEQSANSLSGGQKTRLALARVLLRSPDALLLDEPTNHLDLQHQLGICRLLRALHAKRRLTVVWVSHDLNLASEFCQRLVLLQDGEVIAEGPPAEVVTAERLQEAYGVAVPVRPNPLSGRPQVILVNQSEAQPA